jgi:hypothetical protein
MEGNYKRPRYRGHFVGSATVVGASYGHGTTSLELQTFTGEYIEYSIDAVPDSEGAAELRGKNFRPLSVKIQNGGERCSVIALTPSGTRPTSVTLGTALALHQSGVHTVIEGGLRAEVSCPRPQRPGSSTRRLKPLDTNAVMKTR